MRYGIDPDAISLSPLEDADKYLEKAVMYADSIRVRARRRQNFLGEIADALELLPREIELAVKHALIVRVGDHIKKYGGGVNEIRALISAVRAVKEKAEPTGRGFEIDLDTFDALTDAINALIKEPPPNEEGA